MQKSSRASGKNAKLGAPAGALAMLHCVPRRAPLSATESRALLARLGPPWRIDDGVLVGEWRFENFRQLSRFVKIAIAVADEENHHPQASFGYRDCKIAYCTHSAGGLSENDFICAAKIAARAEKDGEFIRP